MSVRVYPFMLALRCALRVDQAPIDADFLELSTEILDIDAPLQRGGGHGSLLNVFDGGGSATLSPAPTTAPVTTKRILDDHVEGPLRNADTPRGIGVPATPLPHLGVSALLLLERFAGEAAASTTKTSDADTGTKPGAVPFVPNVFAPAPQGFPARPKRAAETPRSLPLTVDEEDMDEQDSSTSGVQLMQHQLGAPYGGGEGSALEGTENSTMDENRSEEEEPSGEPSS